MTGVASPPSRLALQAEIARLKKRGILFLLGLLLITFFFFVIEPLIPYGPLLIPALALYAGNLPDFPMGALVIVLFVLANRNTNQRVALEKQLKAMEVAAATPTEHSAHPTALPPNAERDGVIPVPAAADVQWFPNRQLDRMGRWVRTGALVLVSDMVLAVGTLAVDRSLWSGPWGPGVGSIVFTSGLFSVMILVIGASSRRKEPRRLGVSFAGIHRELVVPPSDENACFIPWSQISSARGFGIEREPGVLLT